MIKLRKGTFETNSSSTHSITICTSDEFSKFENGELYIENYGDNFYTLEQVIANIEEDAEDNDLDVLGKIKNGTPLNEGEDGYETVDDFFAKYEYLSYQKWNDVKNERYETFEKRYKTPSGDEVVAFGYYGNY